jgi:hypothetical protein
MASISARWISLVRSIGSTRDSCLKPWLHQSPGSRAEPPGRNAVLTSKQAAAGAEMVGSTIVAALDCARNSPTGWVRSDHAGMVLMNLVFKPIDSANSSWSPGRHRDRRLAARARLYMLMAAPRRAAAASITRGFFRRTLRCWSAPGVTIYSSCRALTQQIAGGSVIFGSVVEGIGKDQGARDS